MNGTWMTYCLKTSSQIADGYIQIVISLTEPVQKEQYDFSHISQSVKINKSREYFGGLLHFKLTAPCQIIKPLHEL